MNQFDFIKSSLQDMKNFFLLLFGMENNWWLNFVLSLKRIKMLIQLYALPHASKLRNRFNFYSIICNFFFFCALNLRYSRKLGYIAEQHTNSIHILGLIFWVKEGTQITINIIIMVSINQELEREGTSMLLIIYS